MPAITFGTGQVLAADGRDTPLTFASVAAAKASSASHEYQDLKRMLISLELKSVKKQPVWQNYTSANGLGSFDYPDNWKVASREGGRYTDVTDESGRVLLTLGFNQTRNRPKGQRGPFVGTGQPRTTTPATPDLKFQSMDEAAGTWKRQSSPRSSAL